MATTLTTYLYNGANADDLVSTAITINAVNYWTLVAEIAIFYGSYAGANVVPAVQPVKLPPLSDVEFNANFYRVGGAKYAPGRLVNIQPIFEYGNTGNCLGTKFTFVSPIIAPDECATDYVLVWSTNRIEMPYGPDMIYIAAQNGVTEPETPC